MERVEEKGRARDTGKEKERDSGAPFQAGSTRISGYPITSTWYYPLVLAILMRTDTTKTKWSGRERYLRAWDASEAAGPISGRLWVCLWRNFQD